MKTTVADFKKRLTALRRSARRGAADRALAELEKMLKTWPDHPRLLVEKSRLIQLSENGVLPDAKRALQRALQIDASSPAAWIELGYYLLVCDDQAEQAEERFDKAIELGLRQLIEAITAKICAILDQDDPWPARKKTDAADLVRLAEVLAERYGKGDAPEIGRLRERIAEYRERTGAIGKLGHNGAAGS